MYLSHVATANCSTAQLSESNSPKLSTPQSGRLVLASTKAGKISPAAAREEPSINIWFQHFAPSLVL